ncbi:MAG: hypothetical protein AB2A00_39415, partial [Myxococcota bacterium]
PHPTPAPLAPIALMAALALGCTDGGSYTVKKDAGPDVPAGITYDDIGTPCTCEIVFDEASGTNRCARNPTNTCAKSALTCVIATPDPATHNAGNELWEAPLFYRQTTTADGGVATEGECTLLAPPGFALGCPRGTSAILLSTGVTVCKRQCQADQECGRPDWVCDQPLMDRNVIDSAPPGTPEQPLNLRLCRPACQADFPDCNRTTPCTLGRPGCVRSPSSRNAPEGLGIYIGDRTGTRVCNRTTGHCDARTGADSQAPVGKQCTSHNDCNVNNICISDTAYANVPDGVGFCTFAGCDPAQAPGQDGCGDGVSLLCEPAYDMGLCWVNCSGGTICAAPGTKCGVPEMWRVANFDPISGQPGVWDSNHCIDCDLTGVCP